MKRMVLSGLAALSLAAASFAAASPLSGSAACQGEVFNPINDPNWNNMFPVTVAGISMGGGSNPPLMHMDPICMCPGPYGVDMPGIGMTYWEPTFLAEIARTPGCMSTLGGVQVLEGYDEQTSNQKYGSGRDHGSVTRMQVHWYIYPLFSVLNMMSSLGCMNTSGFNLADLTEVDPTWQDDTWTSIAFPESALFANPVGALSCMPDAVASAAGRPLDMMFWCQGSQGVLYPLTGSSPTHSSPQGGNLHVLGKYMQRKTRMAGLLSTIGPWAECQSVYLPNMIRSQYRIDPVAPVPSNQTAVLGMSEFRWGMLPPANTAVRTDSAFLIWVGKQCCAL
ncbi:TraU protein (plasmid) [Halomonas sp. THAF12]|uniref:TraU family protein n=1 Tax=Halomonas sp. THAF12 TaxID=2587849 RepID=UPI0012683D73|nr:TraU family protein [Halomonas sp. THAF12]QFT86913.1 TraU protein [Halomonas sp. THAF12]